MATNAEIRYLNPPTVDAKKRNIAASKKVESNSLITKTQIFY